MITYFATGIIILIFVIQVYPLRPPSNLTVEQQILFTRNSSITLDFFFVDDTESGSKTHYKYSKASIDKMITFAGKKLKKFQQIHENNMLEQFLHKFPKKEWVYAAAAIYASALYEKRVLVLGSSEPWCEAVALASGASEVVTVDYNYLTYGDGESIPIKTISSDDFSDFYSTNIDSFDLVFSISSFDHSGLGRYGDELDHDGDLAAINQVRSIIRPGGLLLMTVPIGPDVIVYNLHRRYGRLRLPLLLEGWKIVNKLAWIEEKLDEPANWRQTYEPVFVLKKDALISDDVRDINEL